MEVTLLHAMAIIFIFLTIFRHVLRSRDYRLPPSPALALPILGHLYLLTKPPLHRTLQRFSHTLGPIISLQFGVRRIVVVSSYDAAEECFTTHDVALANRPSFLALKYLGYDFTTIASSSFGHHWRSLRRLGVQELFSTARLNALSELRQEEVKKAMQNLVACTKENGSKLELRSKLDALVFNVVMRMLAGKQYFDNGAESDGQSGHRFREMMVEFFQYAESSNPEDFLPFLLWIDYRGLKKKMGALAQRLDDFFQSLVEEHRRDKRNTVLGHLSSLQESKPDSCTDLTMKGLVNNVLLAGTESSATTIEWAMSLLLNHPEVLQKAKVEIDSKVGHQRLIEEQDLPNLLHLQSIILETLRMFAPGPLGIPHESSTDCKIGGYDVPRGTILLVNIWAIHRDPKVWDEPSSFKPERFHGKEFQTHRMLPFGLGRRACPGLGLALRMVGLALGSLIQCFEWERVSSQKVDLTEGSGLSMPKLNPLEAMVKPREAMLKALHESVV